MSVTFDLEAYFDKSQLNVCIKSEEKVVLYQNESCQVRCGRKQGQVCTTGCMKTWETARQKDHDIKIKSYIDRDTPNLGDYRTTIYTDGPLLVTLAVCEGDGDPEFLDRISRVHALTKTECSVASLKLRRFTIKEISKRLHVAHSTIKTHLRNIRAKCSAQSWFDFQNRCNR